MRILNRAVLLVRYREPYLRWAASLDEKAPDHAGTLKDHVSVYLVPEDPLEEHETHPLTDCFVEIFEHELEDWCTDEALWPARRDFATFQAWFEVTGQSIVLDLGRGAIRGEEY
jgi:hypothetical protein